MELAMMRVDGRRILQQRLSASGVSLPVAGAFAVTVRFDPLILGADLYRLDVTLMDADGPISMLHSIFEVIDEEGQSGGKPLLFHPPIITGWPIGDISS